MRARPVFVLLLMTVAGCTLTPQKPEGPQISPRKARIDAVTTLRQAADSPDPFTRMHAMEAIAAVLPSEGPRFLQGLRDAEPAVQFAAAFAVGDARYAPAMPELLRMADAAGPDKRIYSAVIYALHRLGEHRYTGDLGRLLHHREEDVRANAALVLGRLGEPSAAPMLKSALADERSTRVQLNIEEALALLGDPRYARRIEAYTHGYDEGIRLMALPALTRSGSTHAVLILQELAADEQAPPRVRTAAVGELGRLGQASPENSELCVQAVQQPRAMLEACPARQGAAVSEVEVNSLQQLSAKSLGHLGQLPVLDVLYPLLHAPDGGVRVAAAMSILRLAGEALGDAPGVALPRADTTRRAPAGQERPRFGVEPPAAVPPPAADAPPPAPDEAVPQAPRRGMRTAGGRD